MEQKNNTHQFIETVRQHWFGVVLTLVGVIVVVIGLVFWVSQEREKEDKAAFLYDEAALVLVYQLPFVSTNANMVNEISQYVLAKLDSVHRQYPQTISAMRARLLLARLYAQSYLSQGSEDSYNQALQFCDEVVRLSSRSFYRGLALINKAQLLEHHSEWQSALDAYRTVARKYNEFYTPYAWVSMGRVAEVMGDAKTAMTAYEMVVQKYTNSAWYGLALGRLTLIRQYGVQANTAPALGSSSSIPVLFNMETLP
jgi:tetratricopeptide (TPR) repeat protein